jgi:hypothetical protein
MSDDGPEWFAPKRYGYGSGLPISWQGWAVTIGFVATTLALTMLLRNEPVAIIPAIIPLALGFSLICARTTRGGWRWRWGKKD